VIALSSLAFASGLFGPPASYFADFSTSVGEIRTVTLKDGSRVDLDTATSFDVDADQRNITLHTGRIFVQVAPDPSRPFSVKSGETTVRALGTAFVVRRDGDATTVAVTEHAVSFSSPRDSLRVQEGNTLTYSPARGFEQSHPIDVDTVTSWRRGELAFGDRPLSDVVKEIERYHRGKIIIVGDAVGRLPVSGVFDARDTDTLFASIELALPVQVIRLPGVAILRWNPSRAPPPRS
jgi:transmembrane sensor